MSKNPWRYLTAYKEEDKDTLFCGREKESYDLYSFVKKNLFVTLYGCTGIGKTSLLEAGVFPLLRRDNYIPIVVRFGGQGNAHESFANIVVSSIESLGLRIEKTIDDNAEADFHKEQFDIDFLWTYFATRRFYKGDREVFPVVVLDQFEESLILSSKDSKLLLEQIYSLIDDNKNYPAGYHSETNFRFVISIREDELYRLEEIIDKSQLLDFKNNRYRLRSLSKESAMEVIYKPGHDYLPNSEDEKLAVVEKILKQAATENDEDVNPLLLSLVCSCLYDRCNARNVKKFTLADVDALGDNLLIDFYNSLPIKKKTRRIIEGKFVDANGRRNAVNKDDILGISQTELDELSCGNKHILQKTNNRLELVHDLLAQAIFKTKNKSKEEKASRTFKICLLGFFFIIFVLAILRSVFVISGTDKYDRIPLFHQIDTIDVGKSVGYELTTDIVNPYVVDAIISGDSNRYIRIKGLPELKRIIVNTSGLVENKGICIEECPKLERIIVQTNGSKIDISDCPRLRYLELPDTMNEIEITNCPYFKTLYLPNVIDKVISDKNIKVVPPSGSSRYIKSDNGVWDIKYHRIVYHDINNKIDSINEVFPLQLYSDKMLCYRGICFYNDGMVTDAGYLVSKSDPDYVYDLCDTVTSFEFRSDCRYWNLRDLSHTKLRRVIIRQSSDIDIYDIKSLLTAFQKIPYPLVYEVKGDGPLKKTADGVIWLGKEPVLISAESKKSSEVAYFKDTTVVCMKGWRGLFIKEGAVDFWGYLKELPSDIFFPSGKKITQNYILVEDEETNTKIYGSKILQCRKLSPKQRVFRLSSSHIPFLNLQDSVRKEITLEVPYGKINQYIYNPNFDGFKDIREETLMETLWSNSLDCLTLGWAYLKVNRLEFALLMVVVIIVLLSLYFLMYKHIRRQERRFIAIRALLSSLSIVIVGAFVWVSVYWFLWFWFFGAIADNIIPSIVALLFALAMVGFMYRNTWLTVSQKIIVKLRRLNKNKK